MKTLGTIKRQIKRLINRQALLLSLIGIPVAASRPIYAHLLDQEVLETYHGALKEMALPKREETAPKVAKSTTKKKSHEKGL